MTEVPDEGEGAQRGSIPDKGNVAGDNAPDRDAPGDEQVKHRASALSRGGREGPSEVAEDDDGARLAAQRILEDSEERTFDPATLDPEDDGVIRRRSGETA